MLTRYLKSKRNKIENYVFCKSSIFGKTKKLKTHLYVYVMLTKRPEGKTHQMLAGFGLSDWILSDFYILQYAFPYFPIVSQ